MSDAVVSLDNDGRVTYLNATAERQYGVVAADALGSRLETLYKYRWIRPADEASSVTALERDGFWRGENLHILPDGRVLHVDSSVSVLKDDDGQQVGLLAVIRDVTMAKRVEAALRDRDERMRRVLAIETVGVLFFTLDGHITDANAAFERMSGYSCEELRSTVHWRTLTAPEFLETTRRAAQQLVDTGETAPYEKQMIRKDGSLWWGLFAPKRIAGSGATAECVEFILDISRAKHADAALQELEQRQRMALDAAALGTWRHDIALGRVELDARACEHYGLDSGAVDIADIAARVHPDDRSRLQRAIAAATDPSVRRPVAAEYRVQHPGGRVRWLSVNGQVRFEQGPDGDRATVAVGTTRDVTETKLAEASMREAERRKDEFLAILAHELRNPLAPIRTAVGLLQAENVPPPVASRARGIIERQVAHMARLVDDLLDVSRLSRGEMSLQLSVVPLDAVLDLAVETARPLIQERGHTLTERRGTGGIVLQADVARLSQVFANLLNNAAKYTPPGGSIVLEIVEHTGRIEVRVSDTGEGIAADHLERVFDMFAQGGGTSNAGAGGLGIGLALARRLVELHRGSLTAFSEGAGQGATFTATLPTTASQIADTGAAESPRVAAPLNSRVLVVDDNVDAADATVMFLRTLGCDVRAAYGGDEALQAVRAFEPDIVLLDLGMPGVNGLETCRRIRGLPWGASVFIVALTGWGQEGSRRQTRAAGFDAHLVKPVASAALLQLVRGAPGRAR